METYELMHKDLAILSLEYDPASSRIADIIEVFDLGHAPLSVANDRLLRSSTYDLTQLMNRWLSKRSIPLSRHGIAAALRSASLYNTRELAIAGLGASLTDCYWLRPKGGSLTWDDINFYDNDFDFETGLLMAGNQAPDNSFSLSEEMNPSYTTDGALQKAWRVDRGGARVLVKGGSGVIRQEPFNEEAASLVYEKALRFGSYCPYKVVWLDGRAFSSCPAFTSDELEFVCANDILNSHPLSCGSMRMDDYVRAAAALEIPGIQKSIETQLIFDFVLGNTDRHTGNFGALRNSDTLKYAGPAPIFDTGLSLLCQVADVPEDITDLYGNPFRPRLKQQLAMCSDFSGVNIEALLKVSDGVAEILSRCPSRYMDEQRLEAVRLFVQTGAETVAWHAEQPRPTSLGEQMERAEAIVKHQAKLLRERGGSPYFSANGFADALGARPSMRIGLASSPRTESRTRPSR